MRGEQTYPWKSRKDYGISPWVNDLLNIVKNRAFLAKKEDAFLLVMENMDFFLEQYCNGFSPMSAWTEFNK